MQQVLSDIEQHTYDRRWGILAVLCISLLIVMLGNTSLNLALPTLGRDLGASSSQQQWMVDAYSLVFAGLLFTMSSLGERFGRKGIMQLGLVLFGGASAYAGLIASSPGELIVSRIVMGAAGAMIMPATLSILMNVFPREERAKAVAIWAGVAGGGGAIGMLITGFVLEHSNWNATFLIVLPIALVAIVAGAAIIPTSRDPDSGKLDLLGAVLSTAGLSALVYSLIEAPLHGWTSFETLALLAAGLVLIAAFTAWELRTKQPMLDVRLFQRPAFGISAMTLTLVFFALMGLFFSVAQLFQLVMGYGTFEASLRMAPIPLFMMFASPLSPAMVKRWGKRRVVATGLFVVAAGILILATLDNNPSYYHVLAGMALMATGMALTMSPTTDLLMSAVPRTKAGMGSATNDTTRELGGSLGVAVLGSIIASNYASNLLPALGGLTDVQRGAAQSSLGGAFAVAQQIGGAQGAALLEAAQGAWMSGLSLAMFIGAGIVAIAAVIAFVAMPEKAYDDEEEAEGAEADFELVSVLAAVD